jgi:hypothetical protein
MRLTRPITLATCGLLVAALASCGGSSEPAASPTKQATRPPTATKVQVPPGTGKGFVGARNDVTVESCQGSGGVWVVRGAVTNSSAALADYRIYTSFLTADNDTRGLIQTDVARVAPKAKVSWAGQLRLPESGLRCILRVERTARRG